MRIFLFFLILTAAIPAIADDGEKTVEDFWGKTVRYIRLESPGDPMMSEARQAIRIREGDILTRDDVRDSLRRINLLERYRNVAAMAEPFEDGCALVFRLEPDWVIRSIEFSGGVIDVLFRYGLISRFSPKSLKKQINIQKGDLYSEKSGIAAVQALKDFYFNNGYAQADIELNPVLDHQDRVVDMVFSINQGEPTLIRKISFEGNKSFQTDTLTRKSGIAKKRKFSRKQANDARIKLESYYKRHGFINIQVYRPVIQYDRESNSISINYKINEDNPVDIRIKTKWHNWNLMWWFYFLENRSDLYLEILGLGDTGKIDRKRFVEGVRSLEKQFWNHGFVHATVRLEELQDADGHISYHFIVDEKQPLKVSDVKIQGNNFLTIDEVESGNLVATTPGKRFHHDTFIADGEDIRRFYLQNGFHDVRVVSTYTAGLDRDSVSVVFGIEEGNQYLWADIVITGNTALSDDEILRILTISPSSPYRADTTASLVDGLIDHYLGLGYADISIDWNVTGEEARTPVLHLLIHEGVPTVIDTILIKGYTKTLRSVIERNLPKLQGEPYSYKLLLNAERQLIRTNLFKTVDISNPPTEAGIRNRTLLIDVKEQPSVFLEGGPGYNSDRGVNGYISLYTTNLGGSNRYLGISGSVSEKDNKSNIIFREPEFANLPVQLELRLLTEQTEESDYRLNRRGTRATWSYRLTDSLRLLLVYRFDNDEPFDIGEGAEIPDEYRNSVKIGSLTPGYLYDSRDDPRAPRSGSLFSTKIESSRTMYSSEVEFTKITAEAAHFFTMGSDGVLGVSLRPGLGYHLPYQEEFRLGGIKSIRGWDYEAIRKKNLYPSLGISSEEDSDADLSVLFNIEYRFPLVLGLEGVLFFDSGNVFNSSSDFSLSDLKGTSGVGLRFMTPVGPIGVDYGYNVLRDADDPTERWSFVIGHTF